jgi:hypothetical protein
MLACWFSPNLHSGLSPRCLSGGFIQFASEVAFLESFKIACWLLTTFASSISLLGLFPVYLSDKLFDDTILQRFRLNLLL